MGTPKPWLPVAGEPMLARVVRIVSGVVSPVVVVAAVGQELPPLPIDVRILRDDFPGRGPLQGLATGLAELACDSDVVFVSSCDVPLLKLEFVKFVAGSIADFDAAVPRIADRWQPLAAAYRLAPTIRETRRLISEGRYAVRDLFESIHVLPLERDSFRDVDADLDSLRNANTPEEFAELTRRLAGRSKT